MPSSLTPTLDKRDTLYYLLKSLHFKSICPTQACTTPSPFTTAPHLSALSCWDPVVRFYPCTIYNAPCLHSGVLPFDKSRRSFLPQRQPQMGRPTHEAPTRVSTHTNTHTPWQAGGPQATAPCSNRHHASCLSAPTSLLRLLALAAPLVGLRVPITWCGKALDRALAPGGAAASARAGG